MIRVENLGKCYRIHHETRERYTALRDVITNKAKAFWRGANREPRTANADEDFWALKDVSFEVKQGEVVGIIGRNGAGKSTLLKILSRITEPTKGRITLNGRVASLLEVGTGFHPELTGRENIFLNGAILGMTKAEIRSKFDEIVAFAEVEKFLDTPVKRYSSGMYVRLAFAVAAHLEPEVLIIDEVLAVGDTAFQNKCLGKMQSVSKSGRTVLFVSHNISSLQTLCDRGVVLNAGQVAFDGSIGDAIREYSKSVNKADASYCSSGKHETPSVLKMEILSLLPGGVHVSGSRFTLRVIIASPVPVKNGCVSIQIVNQSGAPVLHLRPYDHGVFFGDAAGCSTLECMIEDCWLNVGSYSLTTYVSDPPGGQLYERLSGICPFSVTVEHSPAMFGWRPEACCYVAPEKWVSLKVES
ncbi:MAG: ABC transporter ATP-binding protein [Prosthecobacter sp.]|nr:ABC transporter ATP-binding protein [Prosthecobacter sp.]